MSQFALLLVTDEQTVDAACRGWGVPLTEPIKKSMRNPFTGAEMEVVSYIPLEFDDNPDAAGPYDVFKVLKQAQPVVIPFQVASGYHDAFINKAVPYRITR